LLKKIAERTGLKKLLKKFFSSNFNEILALAFFSICDRGSFHTFPYWRGENHIANSKNLYSSDISALCQELGLNQKQKNDFFSQWISLNNPKDKGGIYFDITSVSSYSTNIDFVEWGYNRDDENLAQINLGLVCRRENALPLYYQIYPGSIPDVRTLTNSLKFLNIYKVNDAILVLDRGFCSKKNITRLNENKDKFRFVQPMTYNLKKVKLLIRSSRKSLRKMKNVFKYNEEILYYQKASLEIEGTQYDSHLYYNEKAEIEQRHDFLAKLLDIEKEVGGRKFESMKEYLAFRREDIPEKYVTYFKLNKKNMVMEKHLRNISAHLSKIGYFLLLSNEKNMNRDIVLDYYRDRDKVEKMFDIGKNELDEGRLRSHSSYNSDGRMFIKFIALILYCHITDIMKKEKLFDKFTVKELIAELSKIKFSVIDGNTIISEISKTQKKIFKAFQIDHEILLKT
jgi:transposase